MSADDNCGPSSDGSEVEGMSRGVVAGDGWMDLEPVRVGVSDKFVSSSGEKRDGTVPARSRRAGNEVDVDGRVALAGGCMDEDVLLKSGKSLLVGDSGIVSRRGVECPLPIGGGRHTRGLRPS